MGSSYLLPSGPALIPRRQFVRWSSSSSTMLAVGTRQWSLDEAAGPNEPRNGSTNNVSRFRWRALLGLDHSELFHIREDVDDSPGLGDSAVGEAEDEDLVVGDGLARAPKRTQTERGRTRVYGGPSVPDCASRKDVGCPSDHLAK
jgi:hypothetical protein